MFSNISLTKHQKEDLIKIILATFLLIMAVALNVQFYFKLALFLMSYFIVGGEVLLTALHNIRHGQVFDENFLMGIATIGALGLGEYAEAVFVMLFYAVGELFESIAVGRSRKSIQTLLEYAPEEARVIRNKEEEIVDPDEVLKGETILVYAGEKIPLDGTILEGKSALNMAFLTGESIPVDVNMGDIVHSGSINVSGVLKIEVTSEFEDSTISKILELIEESTEKKSVLENFITRFARYYTPGVVFAAIALAFLPPLIFGGGFSKWFERALIFLVVSCPCALVVSVPLTFFGGIGRASKNGILVKGSNYLEALSMVDTFVFDKTGTLTEGSFEITEIIPYNDGNWKELAGSLESFSNHPIAASIVNSFGSKMSSEITDVEEIHGMGLIGRYDGKTIAAGNDKIMERFGIEPVLVDSIGTKVNIIIDEKLAGIFIISDKIKDESRIALENIKRKGISELVLLTGDKKEVAQDVASKLGIDKIEYELLPDEKVSHFEEILKQMDKNKMVAYVGDGINDAPVLVRSDVGIAMGALGSDAAIEAADIILMDDEITKIPLAIDIAKKTVKIAKQNVILALGVKFGIMILGIFGIATMGMAIFGDVGVMVLAVLNSIRTMK